MGKLQIRYPFVNNSSYLISGYFPYENTYASAITPYFMGENEDKVGNRHGSYGLSRTTYNNCAITVVTYTPSFCPLTFTYKMASHSGGGGPTSLYVNGTNSASELFIDYDLRYKDHTTLPLYSYETDSTYMFSFGNLANFFMITERFKIDEQSIKSVAIIARKQSSASDTNPLGFYEWNDGSNIVYATDYSNIYTADRLYNASNVGYCSKYSLYQYTRDGYIYPDIYYCDGGLSVPPDGIVRIGTSKFMRLGSNLFLRID